MWQLSFIYCFLTSTTMRVIFLAFLQPFLKKQLLMQNFVETCCQHAALMAGREQVAAEISKLIAGLWAHIYKYSLHVLQNCLPDVAQTFQFLITTVFYISCRSCSITFRQFESCHLLLTATRKAASFKCSLNAKRFCGRGNKGSSFDCLS